jgi:hypothetical protein
MHMHRAMGWHRSLQPYALPNAVIAHAYKHARARVTCPDHASNCSPCPQGRAAVPDSVKADLLMQIKSFMVQL